MDFGNLLMDCFFLSQLSEKVSHHHPAPHLFFSFLPFTNLHLISSREVMVSPPPPRFSTHVLVTSPALWVNSREPLHYVELQDSSCVESGPKFRVLVRCL